LQKVLRLYDSGGVVDVFPTNVFETAWCLQSLLCVADRLPEYADAAGRLAGYWTDQGVSYTDRGMVPDGDCTATALFVLRSVGGNLDPGVFGSFEAEDYFFCFPFERNQSVRVNAGILEAVRLYSSTPERRRMVLKSAAYLRKSRRPEGYWHDKWHISPFYSTVRVVSSMRGLDDSLVRKTIQWVLDQQREDGSWGLAVGNPEETAYGLETLTAAAEDDPSVCAVALQAMQRAADYLSDHVSDDHYPSLWMGKNLYAPHNVVRAAILGALLRFALLTSARATLTPSYL
jgi:halimadienyl-diphosphate synthase